MKKLKYISMVFVSCLVLISCGGGGDDPTPTPTPTPNPPTPSTKGKFLTQTCNMPADASESIVKLQGLTSKITSKSGSISWLTITEQPYTSGTPEVLVACKQNLQTNPRSVDVLFLASNDTLMLTVRQGVYTSGTDVNDPNNTHTDQPAYSNRR